MVASAVFFQAKQYKMYSRLKAVVYLASYGAKFGRNVRIGCGWIERNSIPAVQYALRMSVYLILSRSKIPDGLTSNAAARI